MDESIKERLAVLRKGDIPQGYRKTKAGIMPIDWDDTVRAKDIFKNYTDKKHNGDLEILASTQDNGIVPRSQIGIDIQCSDEGVAGYKKVSKGDFVISLRSFQGGIEYSEYEGIVSPAYTILKPIKEISDGYFRNYFKTNTFIQRLNSAVYGIRDGKQIGYQDFGDLHIHYPPIAEQKKIAEILSQCDKIIKLKNKRLESEIQIKKALLEKLLSKSNGFQVKKVHELFSINSESLSDETALDYSFYYIDIASVNNGQIDMPCNKITFREAPVRARKRFRYNDILLSTVRPYLHSFAHVDFQSEDCIASTGFAVLSPKKAEYSSIVFHQLFSKDMDRQFKEKLVGTNYPALNSSDVASLEIMIPDDEKLCKYFADILSKQDVLISALEKELYCWKEKKKALVQLLLTGIVRVKP